MIFVTHIAFRAAATGAARGGVPIASCVGALLVGGILLSTWWVPGLESTLVAGGPWLVLLAVGYRLSPVSARG